MRAEALLRRLLPPVLWLGVWQACAFGVDLWVSGRGNELLLPYPFTVACALAELALTPRFWETVLLSLCRVFAGAAAGGLAGVLLAWAAFCSPLLKDIFAPAIRVIRATPVASFILLLLLWTRRGFVPAIMAGLMVLPIVWENLIQGLRQADSQLLELAQAYRFSTWQRLRLIYIPTALPYFRSALLSGIGLGWKAGVAAEVLCLPRPGMGTEIYNAKLYLEIPDLFAWTAAVVALSLLMEWLLARLLGGKEGK